MDILEKIDKLRIEKGWTLYKLAEESSMLNNYRRLSNKHKIAVNNLIKNLINN